MVIDLDRCVVRLNRHGKISAELAKILDPADMAGIQWFRISPDRPTEKHYHDYDEYWLFTSGETVVTLRREDGTSNQFEVSGGTLIVTPRGVEHGHRPRTEMEGYQWCSVLRAGARKGHLQR